MTARTAPRQRQAEKVDDDVDLGLTALDWVVLVAAVIALGVLLMWLAQGQPAIPHLGKLISVSRETASANGDQ